MTKQVKCDCGKTIREDDDETLVRNVQQHARQAHDMELTRGQVVGMARPA